MIWRWLFTAWCLTGIVGPAWAQLDFERPPISYGQASSQDPVARFRERLEAEQGSLEFDAKLGWLPSLLQQLDVDSSSQVLVFSKTSLQLHKIAPHSPRAIYFNDDVYIGYCHHGDLLEIAATDPQLGAVFYTLDQTEAAPRIIADRGQCLSCHATHRTQGVPGYLVRSIYPDRSGRPRSGSRSYVTDHTTDFSRRFGGWYVSGQHGSLRHLGNALAVDPLDPERVDSEAGAKQGLLSELLNVQRYLTPHSDLVALMVLEHQTQMHNLLARASMETRHGLYHDQGINRALERPEGTVSESTERRIARAAEDVVRYLLFADEPPLADAVRGSSDFAERFEHRATRDGQRDGRGRSLREFDLQQRLFRYPCSYLIYSDAFRQLPQPVFDEVRRRLHQVLVAAGPLPGLRAVDG